VSTLSEFQKDKSGLQQVVINESDSDSDVFPREDIELFDRLRFGSKLCARRDVIPRENRKVRMKEETTQGVHGQLCAKRNVFTRRDSSCGKSCTTEMRIMRSQEKTERHRGRRDNSGGQLCARDVFHHKDRHF